jgi:hypothetical protein
MTNCRWRTADVVSLTSGSLSIRAMSLLTRCFMVFSLTVVFGLGA